MAPTKTNTQSPITHPKTLLVCAYAHSNEFPNIEDYQEEFLNLVTTCDYPYDLIHTMKLRTVDNNMLLTTGKLEELKKVCFDNQIEEVLFSNILSPLQERNLAAALGCLIGDREKLILNIFRNSAHTSEGKIQVEMAEIEYMRTRIIGRGAELAQQIGGIGARGPGETEKEELRRQFADKTRQSKKRLEILEKSRDTQRKQRLASHIPLICIIGYTNAGKSSLLNRLTKSEVLAENKLFATLDTTTRELFLNGQKKALISDTVGFISQLPHNLIAAFKSTLNELQYASLLVHVIDISNRAWKIHIDVVNKTLKDLNVNHPIIYVFNKIDKLEKAENREEIMAQAAQYSPHLFIHTMNKEGVAPLATFLNNYHFGKGESHDTENSD